MVLVLNFLALIVTYTFWIGLWEKGVQQIAALRCKVMWGKKIRSAVFLTQLIVVFFLETRCISVELINIAVYAHIEKAWLRLAFCFKTYFHLVVIEDNIVKTLSDF